jgi:antitoxin (DNA-binding transcriptional repressor) of toxin-antitoxin stability system
MKPKKYTVEEAAKNLSKLIRETGVGRDVYITCEGKPVVKVVAIGPGVKKRVPGGFEGKIWWTDDCFDPLTDKEMKELGFE